MFEIIKQHKSFGGNTIFCEHDSPATKTKMKFSAFLPKEKEEIESAIIWLSGLTCTEENFITKAGAQAYLQNTKTMIICPDTSPRGLGLPGEDDSYDFGSGAGFYINASKSPYDKNYQMEDYIIKDLINILREGFGVNKFSIMGHSMGGHGALTLGLKNSNLFESISAFSPIVSPINCPWGQKAFNGYLGDNKDNWRKYDACELIKSGHKSKNKILIEQGTGDEFLKEQLKTHLFEEACKNNGQDFQINMREGFDHSYYFIASFIKDHIEFHIKSLHG